MDYTALINKQRAFFHTRQTIPISYRIRALTQLGEAVRRYESEILHALKKDLNKSDFDAYSTEVGLILQEIRFVLKRLRGWAKPRKVKTPLTHIGSTSRIYTEPYGVALIISPWNFPFQLALAPLIGAVAAGNCAILKPSELSPVTSDVIAKMLGEIYEEQYVAVVQGGAETSRALLDGKADYIFYTGSVPVGKLVMEAAARNLTPVTLELGGKSPCIVHEDAQLKLAAKRIAWGKFTNAGQTCIAPDYVYVHRAVKEQFLTLLHQSIQELFGGRPLENEAYTRIVSDRHFRRLQVYLQEGRTFAGGRADADRLRIEPTVLTDVTWDDEVMQDEIFGPILPILEYERLQDVLDQVNGRPKPLALYIFSESGRIQQRVLTGAAFGGGCVNDTVYHFTNPYLPFGGVGGSGIGAYHGKGSFDAFSHRKSVLKQTTLFDIPFRYPNVRNGLKKLKLFLK